MSELLPCPFCGEPCDECENPDGDEHFGCSGVECTARFLAMTEEQWNCRAPQPPVAQVDERKTVWMPDYYASSVDLPDGAKWAVRHCRGEHIVAITTTQKWAETIALCLDKEAERRASLARQARAALTPTAEQSAVRSDNQESSK